MQLSLRSLLDDTLAVIKPTPTDTFEAVDLEDVTLRFLYRDDAQIFVIDDKSLAEFALPIGAVGSSVLRFLESGATYRFKCENGVPLAMDRVRTAVCTVARAEPLDDTKRYALRLFCLGEGCNTASLAAAQLWKAAPLFSVRRLCGQATESQSTWLLERICRGSPQSKRLLRLSSKRPAIRRVF